MLIIQSILVFLIINQHISFLLYFIVSAIISVADGMIGRVNSLLSTIMSGMVPIAIALAGVFMEYRPVYELFVIATIILWKSKAIQEF